jgi:hypothetical protein
MSKDFSPLSVYTHPHMYQRVPDLIGVDKIIRELSHLRGYILDILKILYFYFLKVSNH